MEEKKNTEAVESSRSNGKQLRQDSQNAPACCRRKVKDVDSKDLLSLYPHKLIIGGSIYESDTVAQ